MRMIFTGPLRPERMFMSIEMETRAWGRCELRAAESGTPKLEGRAIPFNSLSVDLGGFREIIDPGAFVDSVKSGPDIRLLIDHDAAKVLGRVSARTLVLEHDADGMKFSADLPDTSYSRDLQVSLKRGDVNQMSFGFICGRDAWASGDGGLIRTIQKGELLECSVVTFPAYPQTSAAVRSVLATYRATRTMTVNEGAVKACREAISAGDINEGAWDFTAEDGNALLGAARDWTRYGVAHLAEVPQESEATKERWAYPWGKLVGGKMTVFSRAISAALARSADAHPAIHSVAKELKADIDEKLGKRSVVFQHSELRQRLAEL